MSNEWTHGICGCTRDVPWCLITCCFPFVTSSKVGMRLGLRSLAIMYLIFYFLHWSLRIAGFALNTVAWDTMPSEIDYGYDEDYDQVQSISMYGFLACAADFLAVLISLACVGIVWKMRVAMRSQYDIAGDKCEDCVVAFCCGTCVLCQMHNHLNAQDDQDDTELLISDNSAVISRTGTLKVYPPA